MAISKFGGSEGIQTLTRSVQDFYAVNYITNPKFGTDGEIRTHITLFLRQVPLAVGLRRREMGIGRQELK